ncbi:MAG: hypothetical protein CL944_02790 [Candidatus Diapherotrites archaeon]|uniref:Uncharacterized protein n=1 Tax=Candidatus Iainarchaeum sp. TaxID=3101447 RepID=A0A2D6LQH0_9ARCH|nr:hypothetical protein [Candidatus Diapherotrites archaeon]
MEKQKTKGQIFSLDFLIAMTLAVLAIGMLLNVYELSAYEIKEARLRNELTAIAINAGNNYLGEYSCTPSNSGNPSFNDQGYELLGCVDTPNFQGALQKRFLMIPETFGCYITLVDETNDADAPLIMGDCSDDAPEDAENVLVIKREFLSGNNINKDDFDNCITSGTNCPYDSTINELTIKVWKE